MNFHELRNAVFLKTPLLQEVLEKKGTTPLLTYFEESLNFAPQLDSLRQGELLAVVGEMIEKIIDKKVGKEAVEQLKNHYYASTADHHGPITHPFFVNSHLAQSHANQKQGLNNIFVFSCSGISLNNSSFPRAILFHDTDLNQKRFNLISLKYRHHPVFSFPAYTSSDIHHTLKKDKIPQKLKELIEEVYMNEVAIHQKNYADQITYSNYLLWKKIPGQEHMNLIYLAQEEIINQLLVTYHLNTNTILTRLLTDKKILEIFEKYFDGIQGAFSSTENRGTMLFWVIENGERKQLKRNKNILETIDQSYQIELTADALKQAIENHELMPSMALSLITLSFYYGLTCGGGFLQVNYLTQMKEAYTEFLKSIKEVKEAEAAQIKTDYFCGEFVLATLANKMRTAHASSIDLILYGNQGTEDQLQELERTYTLGEAVDHMMPKFYKILYGEESQVLLPKSTLPPCIYV